MSEENTNNEDKVIVPSEQIEEISKTDAMAGVFTAPGETFESIAAAPKKNYWTIPVLICVAVGLIATFLFMQDSELISKTMEKQKQKMMEKFEQNVKDGKMTQEQVDKAMESMNPKGMIFKVFGYGGALIGPFILLLLLGAVYLIILKIMKAEFEFANILNVVGLAMLLTAVGSLIGIVISILKGDLASLGLGLIFKEDSIGPKLYTLLSKIDVFNIWFYVVVGIGISKIAKMGTGKSIVIAFIPFVIYLIITVAFA